MNPPEQKWERLAAAVRRAGDTRDTAAPYGFATRVAALAMVPERNVSLLERFSLRAVAVAALLAVVCVAADYPTVAGLLSDDTVSPDDPVAEVVDLAS